MGREFVNRFPGNRIMKQFVHRSRDCASGLYMEKPSQVANSFSSARGLATDEHRYSKWTSDLL